MLLKVLTIFFVSFFIVVTAHPQCLDYRPPFEAETPLLLCSQYQNFTCCLNDTKLKNEYDVTIAYLSPRDRENCSPFIRDIMCQRCSPYAAHAYNAEGSNKKTVYPKLCTQYYNNFKARCGHLDLQLVRDVIRSSSSPYCYPQILGGISKLGALKTKEDDGCIELCVEEVIEHLHSSTSAKHAGDGSHRFFVAEQRGVIRVFDSNFRRIPGLFLDIRDQVDAHTQLYDERGLLDFEFHPNYAENGKFYVYFTTRTPAPGHVLVSRLSEFQVDKRNVNRADRNSERVLLDIEQVMVNHNGGTILFYDNLLYLFTGDGGHQGDPHNYSQSLNSLLGKALRIDVNGRDGNLPYRIPRDNPFVNRRGSRKEIFAYGFRNPWRCSVDRGDPITGEGKGRIFCGDVGQDKREEVDLVVKGGNYGWNGYEGTSCFKEEKCKSIKNHVPPIHEYGHDVGLSVIGGIVYRGCQSPNLQGHYIYGDWNSNYDATYSYGSLFSLRHNGTGWQNTHICMGGYDVCTSDNRGKGLVNDQKKFLTSIAQDESGEIYLIQTQMGTIISQTTSIYRLVDPTRRGFTCSAKSSQSSVDSSFGAELEFRLVNKYGLPLVGRVEVKRRDEEVWGRICTVGGGWTTNTGTIICNSLGYSHAYAVYDSDLFADDLSTDGDETVIKLQAPKCRGEEHSLSECRGFKWGKYDRYKCTAFNYASLLCM